MRPAARLIDEAHGAHVPERTCILTRRKGTPRRADPARARPRRRGRARRPRPGAGPRRLDRRSTAPTLDAANAKGKLQGRAGPRLQDRRRSTIPADLGERIEAALRQAALDRLGLEARAGNLITGADRIETAARAGKVRLLIHAADAGEDGRRKLDQAWRVGGGGRAARGWFFPRDAPSCRWRWAAKMWYISP